MAQRPTPCSCTIKQAGIELFSDEDLTSVLGFPHEYQNAVYGGTGFDWYELTALSPIQFPGSINENDAPAGHMLPVFHEESKLPDHGWEGASQILPVLYEESELPDHGWKGDEPVNFSMV